MSQRVIPIRASSFGTILDCAHRFEGEQLLGMRKASSLRAWLGTSTHAGTAAFDNATISGAPISADDAAGVLVDMLWSPEEKIDLKGETMTMRDAEKIALTLLAKYCSQIAPTMDYQSVEMPLEPLEIDCGDNLVVRLTGTMDRSRVARVDGRKIIADLKTGGRLMVDGKVSVKARAAQLGTYQLLSEHTDGEQTDGSQIIALQTSSRCETGVSEIFDAKAMMVGKDGAPGLLDYAVAIFKSGLFTPNPQSQLCGAKYCARYSTCKYHT